MTTENLKGQLRSGFMLLAGRSLATKILQVGSALLLAYKLSPADYGTFGIIYGFVSSLIFLTDIGLGDLLIQKIDELKEIEVRTYIGFRLALGTLLFIAFSLLFPFLKNHYGFDFPYSQYAWIIALILPMEAYIGAALVTVQKTLKFHEIARIELIETAILYCIQITLAYYNFGIWSLFIAILTSRLLKTIYCLSIMPFSLVPSFDFKLFKNQYRNGLFFQLNSIIPTSKAMLLPMLLALYMKVETIGIIFWVTSLVSIPMALAYNYNSILFPALSQVQNDDEKAKEISSSTIEKMFLVLAFIFGLGGIVGDQIIELVFSSKWSAAKDVIFLCALYHFAYCARFICYPILYAKNLAHKRTIGELLLVLFEYLAVFLVCKQFQAKGYFASLVLINFISFFYFAKHAGNWMRKETYRRLLVAMTAMILSQIIVVNLHLNMTSVGKLISEALIFIFVFITTMIIFDLNFRDQFKKTIKKRIAHA